jgi:hypothetical protein
MIDLRNAVHIGNKVYDTAFVVFLLDSGVQNAVFLGISGKAL